MLPISPNGIINDKQITCAAISILYSCQINVFKFGSCMYGKFHLKQIKTSKEQLTYHHNRYIDINPYVLLYIIIFSIAYNSYQNGQVSF